MLQQHLACKSDWSSPPTDYICLAKDVSHYEFLPLVKDSCRHCDAITTNLVDNILIYPLEAGRCALVRGHFAMVRDALWVNTLTCC